MKTQDCKTNSEKQINIQDSEALEIWLKFCKTYLHVGRPFATSMFVSENKN